MHRTGVEFEQKWNPFQANPSLQIRPNTTTGVFPYFNPSHSRFNNVRVIGARQEFEANEQREMPPNVQFQWSSRNNRKGRHALIVTPAEFDNIHVSIPPATSSPKKILVGLWRMVTVFPFKNISWQVAVVFTVGSILWVLSSLFTWIPLQTPGMVSSTRSVYSGGITAFIGSFTFVVASVLLVLETVNQNRDGCCGWEVVRELDNEQNTFKLVPAKAECIHRHSPKGRRKLTWVPNLVDLKNHYIHELGFWSSLLQAVSSIVFLVPNVAALPPIYLKMQDDATLLKNLYRAPKIAACVGFFISGIMVMLECQKNYWTPAIRTLGWYIGIWKTIGSVGFMLMAILGIHSSEPWSKYHSAMSCIWGSFCFLVASLLLWYECLAQYPVEVLQIDPDKVAHKEKDAQEEAPNEGVHEIKDD